MSVYITNLEMPSNCEVCPLNYDSIYCMVTDNALREKGGGDFLFSHERHPNCPLVSVPQHGRLGDLDELKIKIKKEDNAYGFDSYGDGMYDAFQSVYQCIDAAPTIIPASEEEMK